MSPASSPPPGPLPIVDDGVVALRVLAATDVEALVAYAQDPEMIRWTAIPQPYARSNAEAFVAIALDGWARRSVYHFAIESQGRFAGVLDLRPAGRGLAEVGYGLTAWARGRGLMSRALRLGLRWGFDQAGIEVVHWRAEVGNWPSRRAAWAAGFRVDTTLAGLVPHSSTEQLADGWIAALRRGEPLRPAHVWLDPESISGPGLNLRAPGEPDVPRMIEANRDPQNRSWLNRSGADPTPTEVRERLLRIRGNQAAGRAVVWAVADPDDDRMLGEIMLFRPTAADPEMEVGYWTHPDARGRGVATEAVRLAVRHALLPVEDGGLGLDRVLLRAGVGNTASHRVAEKNGFTRAGLDRRAHRRPDGSPLDAVRFDLLPDELPPLR